MISRCVGFAEGARVNAIGHSRGGSTTKLDALDDRAGRMVAFIIAPGQRGDAPMAAQLVKQLPAYTRLPPIAHTKATPCATC